MSMLGTPNYLAPEQCLDDTDLEDDNLEPNAPVCGNCGHVHLDDEWVFVAAGMCAPDHAAPTVRQL